MKAWKGGPIREICTWKNKKVAAWSQDSHGGIVDWLTMEPGFSEDKLRSIFADVDSNLGLELAMNELVVLKDRLKAYKKAKKRWIRRDFCSLWRILGRNLAYSGWKHANP